MWRTIALVLPALFVLFMMLAADDVLSYVIGAIVLLVLAALIAFWSVPLDWADARRKADRRV